MFLTYTFDTAQDLIDGHDIASGYKNASTLEIFHVNTTEYALNFMGPAWDIYLFVNWAIKTCNQEDEQLVRDHWTERNRNLFVPALNAYNSYYGDNVPVWDVYYYRGLDFDFTTLSFTGCKPTLSFEFRLRPNRTHVYKNFAYLYSVESHRYVRTHSYKELISVD